MEQKKIDRINELSKKARTEGLTEAETIEREALRREFRDDFLKSLGANLEKIRFVEEDGSYTDVKRKDN